MGAGGGGGGPEVCETPAGVPVTTEALSSTETSIGVTPLDRWMTTRRQAIEYLSKTRYVHPPYTLHREARHWTQTSVMSSASEASEISSVPPAYAPKAEMPGMRGRHESEMCLLETLPEAAQLPELLSQQRRFAGSDSALDSISINLFEQVPDLAISRSHSLASQPASQPPPIPDVLHPNVLFDGIMSARSTHRRREGKEMQTPTHKGPKGAKIGPRLGSEEDARAQGRNAKPRVSRSKDSSSHQNGTSTVTNVESPMGVVIPASVPQIRPKPKPKDWHEHSQNGVFQQAIYASRRRTGNLSISYGKKIPWHGDLIVWLVVSPGHASWSEVRVAIQVRDLPRCGVDFHIFVQSPGTQSPSELRLHQLKKYQVIVLTTTSLKDQLTISDYCHQNGIYLVIADTFGLFGCIFTDFGKDFTVGDVTGENPISNIVADTDETGLSAAPWVPGKVVKPEENAFYFTGRTGGSVSEVMNCRKFNWSPQTYFKCTDTKCAVGFYTAVSFEQFRASPKPSTFAAFPEGLESQGPSTMNDSASLDMTCFH
ncbi:hypothetical protein Z517_09292 [Fonsecaea pedrosoi CBS 271.37]|uniref:Uncharacterized protein n=1 Tax=Fonsecaea pedrosoi CBS 271.37 TaxID=1442368 RepID=A0A0D2G832_9EURO|nr:uncharacterized protein Z517_09292 [Fonsecaea pedrosoi CBS 271.37]KIW76848.1 hypothetical protein Z517_09292 [Fonsecaea pedrosoi CBS 271.37]